MKFEWKDGELSFDPAEFPKAKSNALKAAIQKWESVVRIIKNQKTIIPTGGLASCPLCHLYWGEDMA